MRRKLGGALALSLAVSAIHGAATWRGAADLPCGVLSPIDRLLCSPGPQSGPGAEAGGGGPSDNQGSEGGASPPPPATSSPPPAPQYVPDLLNVRFKPRTPAAAVRDELERARVTEYRRIPQIGVYVVRVAPERRAAALASLQASRWVTRAERGVFLHALSTNPNDADWPSQWGLRTVGAPLAWELTRGSSAVVVGVLDTGADEAHPDLRGAFVAGTDLVNGDEAPGDDHGHGTAVAGIIAARTNNRVGIAGICWACLVMPIKVLDSTGTGDDSTIAAGIVEAVDAGAFVINMSFGGPDTTAALGDAIVYAQSKGVVLVVAAGNTGTTEPFYPAAYPGVL